MQMERRDMSSDLTEMLALCDVLVFARLLSNVVNFCF